MKTIAIKLPDDLLAEVQFAAKRNGETRSSIIREALKEYFSRGKEHHTASCLDLARDLAGCIQASSDLSTNPAHLDSYGR